MKVDKETAIVLDTNIFGDFNKYNFKTSKIEICAYCFKDILNHDIFIPSIVVEELKKHIKDSIDLSYSKIESHYIKEYLDVDRKKEIIVSKINEIDDFIKRNKIKIIDCNEYCDLEEINEWYFNNRLPFEPKKKKEFPDAQIVSATKNYFAENSYKNIYFLSTDDGVTNAIIKYTDFKTANDIGIIMEKILHVSDVDIRKAHKYLEDEKILNNCDIYSFSSDGDDDTIDVDYIESHINGVEIIGNNDNKIYVAVNFDLTIFGEFYVIDNTLSVFDREDPECSAIFCRESDEIVINSYDMVIELNVDENRNCTSYSVSNKITINFSDYISQMVIVE